MTVETFPISPPAFLAINSSHIDIITGIEVIFDAIKVNDLSASLNHTAMIDRNAA